MQAIAQIANFSQVINDCVTRRRNLLAPPFKHCDCIPDSGAVWAPKGSDGPCHGIVRVDTTLNEGFPAALQNFLRRPVDTDGANQVGDGWPGHSREIRWEAWRRQLAGSRRDHGGSRARKASYWRNSRWGEVR